MFGRKNFIASLIVGIVIPVYALADISFERCGCQRIVADGLFRTKSTLSDVDYSTFSFQFFCSASEEIVIDTLKKQSQLGFVIPDTLNFSFDALNAQSSLRTWRETECSSATNTVNLDQLRQSFERVGDQAVLAAANQCFQICSEGQGGLFCSLNDIDDALSVASASWTPSDNNLVPPKITGGEIIGGELVGTTFGQSPIVTGAEIRPLGLAATIRRDDPSQSLSVIIQTDNGRCELASDPVKARYVVNASINVSGTSLQAVSKDFRQSLGNSQSCTEGWTARSFLQCVDGDRITEIVGPIIHSAANNGTANYTRDGQAAGKPACAMFHYGYSDRGRGTFGDCKGNGWIDASFTLRGVKSIPASAGPFQGSRDIEIELDAGTVFTIDGSAIGGSINGQNWTYVANIQKIVGGIVEYSAELSPNVPQFQNVTTSIAPNGVLSIQINPN